MTEHSEDFALVRSWLDDDENLRIPDTDWGRGLYAELHDLLAEVERLRKVENDALWLARLACGSSWPMEMAQGVEGAAARVRAAFSGSSGGER